MKQTIEQFKRVVQTSIADVEKEIEERPPSEIEEVVEEDGETNWSEHL